MRQRLPAGIYQGDFDHVFVNFIIARFGLIRVINVVSIAKLTTTVKC